MHWKSLIGFILIMCFQQLAAQEKGKVLVTKDPQIDSLIARRLELNRAGVSGKNVTVSGFRIQIFSGLDRQVTYAEQAKFKSRYPGIGSYISYTQPNYRLRVGDFRTRLEAEKLMNELKKYYTSMFIFSEMIILK
ncbi:MAG: SPOR domain-containing protein [Pedobacter sp.]|jgi:hypothetical protein